MLAQRISIALCLAACLATSSLLAGERISDDDDYDSYAATFDEPAVGSPPEPATERVLEPAFVEPRVGGPWADPRQAPGMMECVSGHCQQERQEC